MSRRALVEKRPLLLAAFAAALAYYYLRAGPWPELWFIPLKGGAIALLALYAWLRHASQDARLLAIMLGIAAVAAMALEVDGSAGHFALFAFYAVALMLFLRHRREALTASQKAAVVALLFLPPFILTMMNGLVSASFILPAYGLAAGAMAASAWASSFPRYRVGAGAVLVLAADLLFFAGEGPLQGSSLPEIFVWPVSFLGQFLICTGVAQTLRKHDPELRLVSSRTADD